MEESRFLPSSAFFNNCVPWSLVVVPLLCRLFPSSEERRARIHARARSRARLFICAPSQDTLIIDGPCVANREEAAATRLITIIVLANNQIIFSVFPGAVPLSPVITGLNLSLHPHIDPRPPRARPKGMTVFFVQDQSNNLKTFDIPEKVDRDIVIYLKYQDLYIYFYTKQMERSRNIISLLAVERDVWY